MDHHQPAPGSNAERIANAVQQRDSTKLHEALQAMFDEEVLPDVRKRLHAERPDMANFIDSEDFAEHSFKEWATQTLEKSLAGIRAQRAQAIEDLRGTAIPYSAFEYTDNDWGLVSEGGLLDEPDL